MARKKQLSQTAYTCGLGVSLWLMTAGMDEMRSGGGAFYTTSFLTTLNQLYNVFSYLLLFPLLSFSFILLTII
jgi:hypothetical protein